MKDYKKIIEVAMGRQKADILIYGAKVLNVFTHEFENKDIAICDEYIAGVEKRGTYKGEIELDFSDCFIVPGFIDAHMHIESSLLTPSELMKVLLPLGTTSIIADSHEIANVLGSEGVVFMSKDSELAEGNIFHMIPSCVPCTDFENTGGVLDADDIKKLKDLPNVLGLGEMMNYPGIINGDKKVLKKLEFMQDKVFDGHAPLVTGKSLQAYASTGIRADHESKSFAEIKERVACGMWGFLREGSSARDLENILPEILESGFSFDRLAFCTDDKNAADIIHQGHIDHIVSTAIKMGLDPINAFKLASYNVAQCFNLQELGSISAGKKADFVILDNIQNVNIRDVFTNGKQVSKLDFTKKTTIDSKLLKKAENSIILSEVKEAMFEFGKDDVDIAIKDRSIIKIFPKMLNNEKTIYPKDTIQNAFETGLLCKVCVIERHKNTGNSALALLEGYGLQKGAIACSIAHDSHNIVCIGHKAEDMKCAVEHIKHLKGGICIVLNGKVITSLTLNIAGLMSSKSAKEVIKEIEILQKEVTKLGIYDDIEPFHTIEFLSLPVIPELRLTDQGLFNVLEWKFED